MRNFRVIVNLSDFFHDHRHKARIFIHDDTKKISDLADRIEKIFHIKNFHLICQHEYLPPSEDVRILQSDDIIWVLKDLEHERSTYTPELSPEKGIKKTHKRSVSPAKESGDEELKSPCKKKKHGIKPEKDDTPSPQQEASKKKKKKEKSNADIIIVEEISTTKKQSHKKKKREGFDLEKTKQADTRLSSSPSGKLKKQKKKLDSHISENGTNDTSTKQKIVVEKTVDINFNDKIATTMTDGTNGSKEGKIMKMNTLLPVLQSHISTYNKKINGQAGKVNASSTNFAGIDLTVTNGNDAEDEPDVKKGEYICNGDLSSYKVSTPLPTTTDQYLKKKKINIVKIEYLHNTNKLVKGCSKIETEVLNKASSSHGQNEDKPLEEAMSVDVGYKLSETTLHPATQAEREEISVDVGYKLSETSLLPEIQAERESIGWKATTEADAMESTTDSLLPNQDESCNELKKTFTLAYIETEYSSPKEVEIEEGTAENLNVENEASNAEAVHENLETEYPSLNGMEVVVEGSVDNLNEASHGVGTSEAAVEEGTDHSKKKHNTSLTSDTGIESLPSISRRESDEFEADDATDLNNPLDETIKAPTGSMLDLTKDDGSYSSRQARVSGVGQLISDLRSSSSVTSSLDTLNSDCTEFVTKRQRKRTRKRKNGKGHRDTSVCSETTTNGFIPIIPTSVTSGPALHIQFEDREDGTVIAVNKLKRRRNSLPDREPYSDISGIEDMIKKPYGGTPYIDESDILKAPLVARQPKTGDVMAFKILIITEQYSPGLSSYIVGKVINYNKGRDEVVYKILSGIDQCDMGGLSVEAACEVNGAGDNRCVIEWKDVMEARLLAAF